MLDVRPLRKPDKHPTIFAAYDALGRGESFVLVNNHDPVHLHEEFEAEHPGGYEWEYLDSGPREWRIEIRKVTAHPLPRLLCDTTDLPASGSDVAGAVWQLETRDRDLDSNIVRLPPTGSIGLHDGPDLDMLIHVLTGDGLLTTEQGTLPLTAGSLYLLPRRSSREFTAGAEGLTYLTVHQRRQALTLAASGS